MAKEFVIKNGLIINYTHAVTGITNNSALTFNEYVIPTEYAVKSYIDTTASYWTLSSNTLKPENDIYSISTNQNITIGGYLQLASGTSVYDISTDSGFTNANDNQIATTSAITNYVTDYTYSKTEVDNNFLSGNTTLNSEDSQIIYNNNGTLTGSSELTFNNNALKIGSETLKTNIQGIQYKETVNFISPTSDHIIGVLIEPVYNINVTGQTQWVRGLEVDCRVGGTGGMSSPIVGIQNYTKLEVPSIATIWDEISAFRGQVDVDNISFTLGGAYGIYLQGMANRANPTITNSYTARFDEPQTGINKGALWVNGTSRLSQDVTIESTTVSTNTSTGALVVGGGIGIGDDTNISGNFSIIGDHYLRLDYWSGSLPTYSSGNRSFIASKMDGSSNPWLWHISDLGTYKILDDYYLESLDFNITNSLYIGKKLFFSGYTNSSPINGDLWYDGSVLYFRSGTTNVNLLQDLSGSSISSLNDLTDVNITTPSSGETLVYNNGIWVNSSTTTDLSNYYTKTETDNNFLSGNTTITDLSGYTTNEVDNNFLSANTSFYTQSEADSRFVSISGDTITGNLRIEGDLYVSGTTVTINTEDLNIKDNIILLNSGETGSGVTLGSSGIQIDRGAFTDYQIIFNEITDKTQIGTIGSLENVATENYVNTTINSIGSNTQVIFNSGGTLTGSNSLLYDGNLLVNSGLSITTSSGTRIVTQDFGRYFSNSQVLRAGEAHFENVKIQANFGINSGDTYMVAIDSNSTDHLRIGIGLTSIGSVEFPRKVEMTNTTTSTSTSTGSLTVAGGLGVVENIYAGNIFIPSGRISIDADSTSDRPFRINSSESAGEPLTWYARREGYSLYIDVADKTSGDIDSTDVTVFNINTTNNNAYVGIGATNSLGSDVLPLAYNHGSTGNTAMFSIVGEVGLQMQSDWTTMRVSADAGEQTGSIFEVVNPSSTFLKVDINGFLSLTSGASINNISTDSGFTISDNNSVATTQAIKNYIDLQDNSINVNEISATTYQILTTDEFLSVRTDLVGTGLTFTLPSSVTYGEKQLIIKDSGVNADINNIDILCSGSDTMVTTSIETNTTIDSKGGSLTFISDGINKWFVI